jgi:hypothetical protein
MANGLTWYWEVVVDRAVLARGLADDRVQARAQALEAMADESVLAQASKVDDDALN